MNAEGVTMKLIIKKIALDFTYYFVITTVVRMRGINV